MDNSIFELAAGAASVMVRSSGVQRAGWLRAVAAALDAHTAELVAVADVETRLGVARLSGEVARTSGQLRLFADVVTEGSYIEATIDHADPGTAPPRPDLRRMLRPLGPVAVFSASNFPFAFSVAGGDTASALAVGCPVIVKAHPGHPELSRLTAGIVQEALLAAGAPVGAFALAEGYEAGVALVQHPVITAVAFTGSVAGGRALHDLAAARPAPIPFYGELGSINPVVVTRAADAARGAALANGLAGSFTLGAGQFCTKPGVVFIPRGSELERELATLAVPAAHTMLTESIAKGFASGVERLLAIPGVERVAGTQDGPLVVTASFDALDAHADELLAEVFGPVTVLLRYDSEEQLLAALDILEGSLTATLHSEDSDDTVAVIERLEQVAGRVLFAGWPTGVAVTWAQHHGGPWPSTTSQFTSVGATAVRRFLRPIAYQDAPDAMLPPALREENPLGIPRRVDGVLVCVT
ncbi:aldehyde dehydrogenase (NADP(+)) [Lacisediminihabitans profunda]|uniref:Aldehyde dehydrogenase (NADP(+)) n=1 Tax=Lacisediminihabitans profunda TaxID=2594790 RepID=A0A5C8USK6_9MICO|nr:aldehyde dehydrogenase (NADP(+)) [Lacisediminihabitans profunda]TXN30913.1 aldehyde dehydrogenase (NADP(+)) [Lacisediminihabitans profunda]